MQGWEIILKKRLKIVNLDSWKLFNPKIIGEKNCYMIKCWMIKFLKIIKNNQILLHFW